MICFLTSNPFLPDYTLSPYNDQMELMRRHIGAGRKLLFVASSPDNAERNEAFARVVAEAFRIAGMEFASVTILDARNAMDAAAMVRKTDVLFLAGGHVPTQNDFFFEIGLQNIIEEFDGVVIGVSAGSMNCAACVYAMPEEDGEAIAYDFYRFIPGLGLTDRMIIPHYQLIRNEYVDGMRAMEDIAYPDSMERVFTVLPDGSYLFGEHGEWSVHGEAYELHDGVMTLLCRENEVRQLGHYGM